MKTNPNDSVTALQDTPYVQGCDGLTKREYFAAMAMQGISSNSVLTEAFLQDSKITKEGVSVYARNAVEMADALIAELNKEVKP